MASKFYLFLPCNTPGYSDNAPNKFRVHLPKAITFDGTWVCGMHSIIYTILGLQLVPQRPNISK